jgi:hypothetical protein
MKLYLAGPMTGYPQFNFPAFDQWARALRYHGFDVTSPAEEDPIEVQAIARASVTGNPAELPKFDGPLPTALRNVSNVFDCDGVALMPGWERSSGSAHEIATAARFGLPVAPVQLWLAATDFQASEALALTDPEHFMNEEIIQ